MSSHITTSLPDPFKNAETLLAIRELLRVDSQYSLQLVVWDETDPQKPVEAQQMRLHVEDLEPHRVRLTALKVKGFTDAYKTKPLFQKRGKSIDEYLVPKRTPGKRADLTVAQLKERVTID